MNLQGKRVAFLGDSITAGAAATEPQYVYHSLLKDKLGCKECINVGVGGTRIARQIKPYHEIYDRDFLMRYEGVDKTCDVLVIFGGTNDYGHGDAPMGTKDDLTEYTFYGALNILYQKAIADFGKENVLILTPMHRNDDTNLRGEGNKPQDGEPLASYVKIIKEVAAKYELKIIDLFSEDCLNPNVADNSKYFADGLHPNDVGHALLSEVLANKIAKI